MDLSIIIPVYEEHKKIAKDISAAAVFLNEQNLQGELIIVDDGSEDHTFEVAQKTARELGITHRILRYEEHRGKGFAVRTGVQEATGDLIMFADSGLTTPYHFARSGMDLIRQGRCDCAHGSRKLPGSVILRKQPLLRRISSFMVRWFLVFWVNLPVRISDSQCGFKIYDGKVAKALYAQCRTNGFLFDVEIIIRAVRSGYRISEFPIEWRADLDSRLSPLKNSLGIFRELILLRRNLRQNGNPEK